MDKSPKRLCYWTYQLNAWLCAIAFPLILSPLWTAHGSSHIPAIVVWAAVTTFCVRGLLAGAIRRKDHLLVRSPIWTYRIRWSDIGGVDLVRSRNSSGLTVVRKSRTPVKIWGSFGTIYFPSSEEWLARASQELQKWISDSK
jgi:hypothetical protein